MLFSLFFVFWDWLLQLFFAGGKVFLNGMSAGKNKTKQHKSDQQRWVDDCFAAWSISQEAFFPDGASLPEIYESMIKFVSRSALRAPRDERLDSSRLIQERGQRCRLPDPQLVGDKGL